MRKILIRIKNKGKRKITITRKANKVTVRSAVTGINLL